MELYSGDDWKWLTVRIGQGGVVGPGSARARHTGGDCKSWTCSPKTSARWLIATATGMNLTTASANLYALKSGGLGQRLAARGIRSTGIAKDVAQLFALVRGCRRASGRRGNAAADARFAGDDHPCELPWRREAGEVTLADVQDRTRNTSRPYPGRHRHPIAELADRPPN